MLVNQIIHFENNFAEIQSNVIETPYGKLFYDQSNPLSYDSNHACIDEKADFEHAVNDIVNFYQLIAVTPRVYTFTQNKSKVGQFLIDKGFDHSTEDICFFVQRKIRTIDKPRTLDFKRINHIDKAIDELYSSDAEQGEWGYKALTKSIKNENYYVFGGYDHGDLVCLASLYKQDDLSRINDVFTKKEKRGLGYGSQLINFITEYNERTLHTTSYLYATNPAAIYVYKKAGYEEMSAISRGCYWFEKNE